jgi:hypothetical protein
MIGQFLRQMRLVLPPNWIIAAWVACWWSAEAFRWYLPWRYGLAEELDAATQIRDVCLLMASGWYGLCRAYGKHPYFNSDYRHWLELTPWTVAKPLPLGPLQLAWQDAIVLGLLALAMYDPIWSRSQLVTAWLLGYGLLIANSLWTLGFWRHGCGVLFLLGLMIRLQPWLWPWMAATGVLLAVLHHGIDRMLARFPWDPDRLGLLSRYQPGLRTQRSEEPLGWPHAVLGPGALKNLRISYRDGVAVSLLTGWWLYAVTANAPPQERAGANVPIILGGVLGCVGFRLLRYLMQHRPSQSRWGMLCNGRVIAPGFDIVFVAPLLTVIAPLIVITVMRPFGDIALAGPVGPVAVSAAMLVALNAGPSYADWALTGDHRTVMGSRERLTEV